MNAQFLVGAHAAVMVPDHELDAPAFTDALFGLLDDPEARAQMRANAKSLAQEQAAGHLADHTEKLGRRAG